MEPERQVRQLRLLLLRHAKSEAGVEGMDDHDRPLSARGQSAAPEMAAYMRAQGYDPALVLCSTATRTRQTLKGVVPAFKPAPDIRYLRALYLADWPAILSLIRKARQDASPLLVIGHNPGLGQLAIALSLQPANAAERTRAQNLAQKFPTAALAVLDFHAHGWRDIKPGHGRLSDYTRPKDLARQGAFRE